MRHSIQDTSKIFSLLPQLYADHDIMKKAVRFYPLIFCRAEEEIRANKEVLITALRSIKDTSKGGVSKTMIFQYASQDLRDDEEVLLQAIEAYENSGFLEYASARMRVSRRVMAEAARKYRDALKYAPQSLMSDPDLVFLAA